MCASYSVYSVCFFLLSYVKMVGNKLINAILNRVTRDGNGRGYLINVFALIRDNSIFPCRERNINLSDAFMFNEIYKTIYSKIAIDFLREKRLLESFKSFVERESRVTFEERMKYYKATINKANKRFLYIDSFYTEDAIFWFKVDNEIRLRVRDYFNSYLLKKNK